MGKVEIIIYQLYIGIVLWKQSLQHPYIAKFHLGPLKGLQLAI
ncbi:MAG: hypothetical protein Edafosvirus4_45 [Edafosvirus sp.]|uniref:Uncharacterized protein n=1 Tax=Edafosvirus sp. TaxID=2487765 RepID=A0A3G4ZVN3_9VIRU|nr:MAG: hypothetical protein Edafosvirus4_45 [Edafosvirus sp.]